MSDEPDIDTELYLRDGFPYATVCKVQLHDGRIGIGLFRQDPNAQGALGIQAADKAALDDALENLGPLPEDKKADIEAMILRDPELLETPGQALERIGNLTGGIDHDLQAQLGHPARE